MVRLTQAFLPIAVALMVSCADVGICQVQKPGADASIADYGAIGDGKTDDAPAFMKAWSSGTKVVRVPAGTFAVSRIIVPEGSTLEGVGADSILIPSPSAGSPLISLNAGATVRDLALNGHNASIIGLRAGKVANVHIRNVVIENLKDMAVETDHTEDMTIEGCTISHVRRAANIQFSHHIHVLNNTAIDCTEHGFQFWGNWKWQSKDASDLFFIGNYVRNGGGGAIWGCGAEHVIIANNIVDGATDVGLDLEWCDDSVISGNAVRHVANSGIALFFACRRIVITGNTVRNDRPIRAEDAKAAWWVRSGIWLTYPNRKDFPLDFGHRDIAITGNIIDCEDGKRRAMWIGGESDNVQLTGNVIRGGKVWKGGVSPGLDQPDTEVNGDATIRANVKSSSAARGKPAS